MSRIKKLLSSYEGRIYVYLHDNSIAQQFMTDAEKEGFKFCDGEKLTQRIPANIMAVNRDNTINYVGTNGRIAYQVANKTGDQTLIKIDYRDIVISMGEE